MVLTQKQRLSLRGKTLAQRQILVQRYNQQNAATGQTSTPRRPVVNRNTNQNTIARQLPALPGTRFAASGIFTHLSIDKEDLLVNEFEIQPKNIPALAHFAQHFEQWSYSNITIQYISTVSSTVHGLILYAAVPLSTVKPDSPDALHALPGLSINSAHDTGKVITVAPHHRNTWYDTANPGHYLPGKFIYAAEKATNSITLGYFRINYVITFRGPLSTNV